MMLGLKIFNTVTTGVIFATIAFLSFAFYLGNQESHQLLEENLVQNVFLRFGAFALFGSALSIIPTCVNLLVGWLTSLPMKHYAYQTALKVASASVVAALEGTTLFFSL